MKPDRRVGGVYSGEREGRKGEAGSPGGRASGTAASWGACQRLADRGHEVAKPRAICAVCGRDVSCTQRLTDGELPPRR